MVETYSRKQSYNNNEVETFSRTSDLYINGGNEEGSKKISRLMGKMTHNVDQLISSSSIIQVYDTKVCGMGTGRHHQ